MDTHESTRRVYLELAEGYDRSGQAPLRDRFLVLAADAARRDGREDEAERHRDRLLAANPHHLLKPFASYAEAAASPDVEQYLRDLRANYPPEVAATLLRSLVPAAAEPAARPIPVTAPLIDLDAGTAANSDGSETLRLTPSRERSNLRPPPAPRAPAAHTPPPRRPVPPANAHRPAAPAGRTPMPLPKAAARPERTVPVRPLPPRPVPAAPAVAPSLPPEPERTTADGDPTGAWLPSALSGVVIVAGAAAAAYTLIEPLIGR